MTAILGLRGTGNWGTDERPKNFRETILFNEPNGTAPLLALTSKIGEQSVNDPEFAWWEELLDVTKVQINQGGNYTSADLALTVDSGALNLVEGDILEVAKADAATYDNEILRVSQDPVSDTVITVTRGYGGTTAATILDDAVLVKIGSAYAEGTGSPTATTRNPTKLYNYCQIFKTPYEITDTAANTMTRTGDPVQMDKKRKMSDHSIAMEYALILGKRSEQVGSNGKPERTTGGLMQFITSNRTIFSGQGTSAGQWGIANLTAALSTPFNYTSKSGDERFAIMGNTALLTLNQLVSNTTGSVINYEGPVSVYGMNLRKFVTPQGILYVKSHPLMSRHPQLTKAALILDMANIKYRPMKGRDTKFQDNIQENDSDTKKGQWLTEAGFEINHEETMAYLGNFGG